MNAPARELAALEPVVEPMSSAELQSVIGGGDLGMQVAVARKYPRNITTFRKEVLQLATLTPDIAAECSYALPRDGKVIVGPSARFGEIVMSAWGNCRVSADITGEDDSFIYVAGMFYDCQRNVGIKAPVKRRITNKRGERYGDDMIITTTNAASSIALRNAILKGVPKAFWSDLWEASRAVVRGDAKTLTERREAAFNAFMQHGVVKERVLALLGKPGLPDVTIDDIGTLAGFLTALKEGDTTVEELFATVDADAAKAASHDFTVKKKDEAAAPTPVPTAAPPAADAPADAPPPPPPSAAAPATAPAGAAPDPFAALDKPQQQSSTSSSTTVVLAAPEEKALIHRKAKALKLDLATLCAQAGISNFDGLTADGYIALKEAIAEHERSRRG